MNNKAITFTSDSNYINYSINLLKSIERKCKGIDVFYRGVNITTEDEHEIMNYDIYYTIDKVHLSTKKNLIKNKDNQLILKNKPIISQILYSEAIAYTCHSRFKNINYLLRKKYDTILALDADSYINKNIDSLFTDYLNYDICTVQENNNAFENEGLLLINRNEKTIKYFREVEKYLFKKGHYKTGIVTGKQ